MPVRLLVTKGPMKGHSFEISKSTVFVGRSSKNDIQIKDPTLSRKHIKLFAIGNKLFVEDLKTTNGTWLNDIPVAPGEGVEISESDLLIMGDTVVKITGLNGRNISPFPQTGPTRVEDRVKSQTSERKERRSLTRNMQLAIEIGELLKRNFSLHELCENILVFLLKNLPRIDRAAIVLFDSDTLTVTTSLLKTRSEQKDKIHPYSRQVLERTLRTGKSVRMSNIEYEPTQEISESISILRIKSLMCVPMINNNRVRGAIYIDSLTRPYAFRKEDLMLLNGLSGPIAVAIENTLLTQKA